MNCGLTPCVERLPASVDIPERVFGGRWILAATVLGSSMEFIDGTVVNVALPSLQRSFAATGTQVQWVVEAYAPFLSALLLTGGLLGDRFGLRKTVAGVAGVMFLMAFVCAENSAVTPLMPLNLFRNRSFTGSNLVTVFLYSALAGALFYLPLNLIQDKGTRRRRRARLCFRWS